MSDICWKDVLPWTACLPLDSEVAKLANLEVQAQVDARSSSDIVLTYVEEHLSLVPLGTVFPFLDPSSPVDQLVLRPRSLAILRNNRLLNLSDILSSDVRKLSRFRTSGQAFYRDVLEALTFASMFVVKTGGLGSAVYFAQDAPTLEPMFYNWNDEIGADLKVLAEWKVLVGCEEEPILSADHLHRDKELQALRRVQSLAASSSPFSSCQTLATLLQERMSSHRDARQVDILRDRILSDNPATLDSIGARHGISRERIRQLEASLVGALSEIVRSTPIAQVVDVICAATVPSTTFSDIVQEFPILLSSIPDWDVPVWRLLSRFSPAFDPDSAWYAMSSPHQMHENANASLPSLSMDTVLPTGVPEILRLAVMANNVSDAHDRSADGDDWT